MGLLSQNQFIRGYMADGITPNGVITGQVNGDFVKCTDDGTSGGTLQQLWVFYGTPNTNSGWIKQFDINEITYDIYATNNCDNASITDWDDLSYTNSFTYNDKNGDAVNLNFNAENKKFTDSNGLEVIVKVIEFVIDSITSNATLSDFSLFNANLLEYALRFGTIIRIKNDTTMTVTVNPDTNSLRTINNIPAILDENAFVGFRWDNADGCMLQCESGNFN